MEPVIHEPRLTSEKVQKIVRKVALTEQGTDFAFWQTQPYHARLATLEQIRQEYHRWRYGTEPRFQRVCRIIKQ
jgi:hypothetical protein